MYKLYTQNEQNNYSVHVQAYVDVHGKNDWPVAVVVPEWADCGVSVE